LSDNILRLIPTDPEFIPDTTAQHIARQMLALFLPQAEPVTAVSADEVQFVDQGENWERVVCHRCNSPLDNDWWQQAMEVAYEKHFIDLSVTLPCCGESGSLNDLHYEWPAGFARFMLEAVNPGAELTEGQIAQLEEWLFCPLRQIWARY
jgi:hypothetical protein